MQSRSVDFKGLIVCAVVAVAGCLCAAGQRTACGADADREGVYKALTDVRDAWKGRGIAPALAMCEVARGTFPESLQIAFAHCMLLEIDGRAERALAEYERLAAQHGAASSPASRLTVREETLLPRYRLNVELGRYAVALEQLEAHWSVPLVRQKISGEPPWGDLGKIEQAVVTADGLDRPVAAGAMLKKAEKALREAWQRSQEKNGDGDAGSILMVYRHCAHELRRLERVAAQAGQTITLPADMLEPDPLDVDAILRGAQGMTMLTVLACGWFQPPDPFSNYDEAGRLWFGAVAERSNSRTIRAMCSWSAAVSALQDGDALTALRYFVLCAETDTWMAPMACAAAARVAAGIADGALTRAGVLSPREAKALAEFRERLAAELKAGEVPPVGSR